MTLQQPTTRTQPRDPRPESPYLAAQQLASRQPILVNRQVHLLIEDLRNQRPQHHTWPCHSRWGSRENAAGVTKIFPEKHPSQCHRCTYISAAKKAVQGKMVNERIGWMVKSINTPGVNDFKTEKQRMHRQGLVLNGFRVTHGTQTMIFVEPNDGVGRENGFRWADGKELAEQIRDLAQPDGRRHSQRVRTIGEFQNRYIISDSFLDDSAAPEADEEEELAEVERIKCEQSKKVLSEEEERIMMEASWVLEDYRRWFPYDYLRKLPKLCGAIEVRVHGRLRGYYYDALADAKRSLIQEGLTPALKDGDQVHEEALKLPGFLLRFYRQLLPVQPINFWAAAAFIPSPTTGR